MKTTIKQQYDRPVVQVYPLTPQTALLSGSSFATSTAETQNGGSFDARESGIDFDE